MKKIMLMVAVAFMTAMCFTSCGDDDSNNSSSDPTPDPTPTALTPAEEKEYLETTAKEFIGYFKAADFDNINNIVRDLEKVDDADVIEDWLEDVINDIKEYLGQTQEGYGYWTNVYTDYKLLLQVSQFKGTFDGTSGEWERKTNTGNLTFKFKSGGETCTAMVQGSGQTAKFKVGVEEDWTGYYSNTEYYDQNTIIIVVPQTLTFTLTKGSNTVVSSTFNFNISGADSEDYPSLSTIADITGNVKVNDYEFVLDKIHAQNNSESTISMTVKKSGKMLIETSASATVKASGAVDSEVKVRNVVDGAVQVNILNKVQVKGTISDVMALSDYINEAEENEDDRSEVKNCIAKANRLLDIWLYNDSYGSKVAKTYLDYYKKERYYGTIYQVCPILEFTDGTTYTFDEYFDEVTFSQVKRNFENLVEDFEDLFDF